MPQICLNNACEKQTAGGDACQGHILQYCMHGKSCVEHVLHSFEAHHDQVFAAANFPVCCTCTHPEVVSIVLQLERKGKPAPQDGGTISDPALLMEVMEQRELVEETNDVGILQVMLQENKLLEQATTEA